MNAATQFLDGKPLESAVSRINAAEDLYSFIPQTASVAAIPLPFYKTAGLLSVRSLAWRADEDALWFVDIAGRDLVGLDGSETAINIVNVAAKLHLTAQNATHYLKYRLYFTHDKKTRVYLIENLFDEPALEKHRTLAKTLAPGFAPPATHENADSFIVSAMTCRDSKFFRSEFLVKKDGSVSAQKETPVITSPDEIRSVRFSFSG